MHGVQHPGAAEDVVLGVSRTLWIAGFVQRTFDEQIADLVARRRAANRIATLDHQHLVAGPGEDRRGGQAPKASANDHDVVNCHLNFRLVSLIGSGRGTAAESDVLRSTCHVCHGSGSTGIATISRPNFRRPSAEVLGERIDDAVIVTLIALLVIG